MVGNKREETTTGNTTPALHSRLRLLVLDPDGQHFLKGGKLHEVFEILHADNIQKGLALAREYAPALLIVNAMGDHFRGELIKNIQGRRIPVLAVIQNCRIPERSLSPGWDDFIQSPFEEGELLLRVQTILRKRRSLHDRYVNFHPDGSVESAAEALLRKVKHAVEENMNNPLFGVSDLARKTGISQPQLYRKLVALTGFSPNAYIRHVRLKHAAHLLSSRAGNVAEIASRVGFASQSYFTKCFKAMHHQNPKRWLGLL